MLSRYIILGKVSFTNEKSLMKAIKSKLFGLGLVKFVFSSKLPFQVHYVPSARGCNPELDPLKNRRESFLKALLGHHYLSSKITSPLHTVVVSMTRRVPVTRDTSSSLQQDVRINMDED